MFWSESPESWAEMETCESARSLCTAAVRIQPLPGLENVFTRDRYHRLKVVVSVD